LIDDREINDDLIIDNNVVDVF